MNRSNIMNGLSGRNAVVYVENRVKRYRSSDRTAVDRISLNDKKEWVL